MCGCRRCRRPSFAIHATTRWRPHAAPLIGWDNDVAARVIGSEVGFVKTFAQGFIYRRLPGRRATIFAAGARLGLAAGFPHDEVPLLDADDKPVLEPDGEPIIEVVTDVPASERFFAGGDTSVRGYALDRLGIPFQTIDANEFPTGGNAVLILNAELRVPVFGGLGAVGFMDAGQVFNRVSDFDFGEIKPTAGLGLRYLSPIGPIRVDVGFKLDRGRAAKWRAGATDRAAYQPGAGLLKLQIADCRLRLDIDD